MFLAPELWKMEDVFPFRVPNGSVFQGGKKHQKSLIGSPWNPERKVQVCFLFY